MNSNYIYDELRLKHSVSSNRELSSAYGKYGIASVSKQATVFGLRVLSNGGNAFDAAFALAFALAFYHPQAGNIGGGGYLLYKRADSPAPEIINYREVAPGGVKIENYIKKNGEVDQEATSFGPSSVCVPGTVKCFCLIQKEYGILDQAYILKELVKEMENGAVITRYQANCLNRLSKKLAVCEESRKHYVKEGGSFREGDKLYNKELIETYQRIAEHGCEDFYSGKIAEIIEEDISSNGGFVTVDDLKKYELKMVEPIFAEFKDFRIWSVPPEGGGSILIDIINQLNNPTFYSIDVFGPEFYAGIAEASKVAFSRRLNYHGDVDITGSEIYNLIFDRKEAEKKFIENILPKIKALKSNKLLKGNGFSGSEKEDTNDHSIGDTSGRFNGVPSNKGETTHFTIIDKWGNVVSNSYTLNLRYGSKWSVRGTGFLMNGSMDAFTFIPGKPNYFNVIGSRYNLLAPNKRPASNMSPVIITGKDAEVVAALGTPGGPAIQTTLATVILSYLLRNDALRSVSESRAHHQGYPDILYWEEGFDGDKLRILEKMGYNLKKKDEPAGDVHGAFRSENGYLFISDYRREGFANSVKL